MEQKQERTFPHFLNMASPSKKTPLAALKDEDKEKQQRVHSSTNTLYVSSMLVAPNKDDLMHCVARAIKLQIKVPSGDCSDDLLGDDGPEIFDEYANPLGDWSESEDGHVTTDQVYNFLTQIFKATKMKTECAIMTLAYIERLLFNPKAKIELTANTWRRIVLAAMIVSDKVFEDYAVWNVDFMNMVPQSSVEDLNKLERKFLTYLNFKTALTASDYAKYYFALRELATNKNNFSDKPLSDKEASKLEKLTSTFQQNILDEQAKANNPKHHFSSSAKEARMAHSFSDFEELKAQILEDQKKKNDPSSTFAADIKEMKGSAPVVKKHKNDKN